MISFAKKIISVLVFTLILVNQSFSQVPGSLFLLPDNFYSQMLNPSFMRHDNAIQFSIPGVAGFYASNYGNFKISDIIRVDENRNPYIDVGHFYGKARENNNIGQNIWVPGFFIGIPVHNGRITAYYKENLQSHVAFRINPVDFLVNGNVGPEYTSFNTENLGLTLFGYKEFAVGYALKYSNKLDVGARVKLLFSGLAVDLKNWNYQINTSPGGDEVHLQTGGSGSMYLPVSIAITEKGQFDGIYNEDYKRQYLSSFDNPGLAIDLGLNYKPGPKHSVSLALRDFGAAWFRDRAYNLEQRGDLNFTGFDITYATRYPGRLSYIYPWDVMEDLKDSIREVFLPFVDTVSFRQSLPFQVGFNYRFDASPRLTFGVANQSVIRKNHFQNLTSFTVMQNRTNFNFFESINLYGFNEINFGGGFQYEGAYGQVFMAVNNILALYHPAGQKTFSIMAGGSFLINREKVEISKKKKTSAGASGRKRSNGKFLDYLPFYKIINN